MTITVETGSMEKPSAKKGMKQEAAKARAPKGAQGSPTSRRALRRDLGANRHTCG